MQVRSQNLNLTLLRALSSHLTSPTDANSFCVPHYRVSDGTAVATCAFLGCNLWPNRSKIRSTNPIKNTAAPPHEYTHHHHFLRFLLLLLPPSAHGALRPLPVFQSIWSRQVCKQRTDKRTGFRFTFILKTEFNKLLENNEEAAPHQRECGECTESCIASPPAAYTCTQTHTDTQTYTVYSTTQTRQRTPTSANNPADDTAVRHIMAQMLCMTYTRKHLSCTHDARARTWRAYTRRIG